MKYERGGKIGDEHFTLKSELRFIEFWRANSLAGSVFGLISRMPLAGWTHVECEIGERATYVFNIEFFWPITMNDFRHTIQTCGTTTALVMLFSLSCFAADDAAQPYGIEQRLPWQTSRVIGSPEPPLPYVAVNAFPAVQWDRPIYAKREPGSNRVIVVQQGGENDRPTKVLGVIDSADSNTASVILEVPKRLVYSVEFDPDYPANGFLYLFSNGPTGEPERVNRISRYTVSRDQDGAVTCDPKSELAIIEWRSMGHDGGDLVFGHDGMLYATAGDGTSDSDNWLSAQDATNLLGSVIRIDVSRSTQDQPYTIPPDNPFLQTPGARGELWAIGLRNPWRMSIDSQTGQIWVGSNGQDLWESVNLLGRGENYGWSVYEGSHPFYPQRRLGPGKLTFPTFEHHHIEARSLTGGVVYDGDQLTELKGAYVYGDYSTGKIWAGRHDGEQVTWHREIADTTLQIAGFANSHQGELLVVDLGGGIHRLTPNQQAARTDERPAFPNTLAETGLFESVADHRVAAGVIPYSINSAAWNDGASVERFLAIPGDAQIEYARERGWNFPDGSVLMQTLSLPVGSGLATTNQRIETRILTRQQGEWSGYSYRWNRQQNEAVLVARDGIDIVVNRPGKDGDVQQQTWRIPARSECMSCHTRAANYVLGLTELQMNREHDYGGTVDNQLRTLEHIGLFANAISRPVDQRNKLPDPNDTSLPLESRAKAYLHTNCSGCHVWGGGGNARMELEYSKPLDAMEVVSNFPQHDSFGIAQPLIVAPGQPDQSVMLKRLGRRGRGQMPPLVSNRVDEQGVELLRQWIASMQSERSFVKDWKAEDFLQHLPKIQYGRSFERGQRAFRSSGCDQCHRLKDQMAGIGPNLNGLAGRMKLQDILTSILAPSESIEDKYAVTIIATADGQVLRGIVESESDEVVVLREVGPTTKSTPVPKADIEQRKLSPVSMMPTGTINHLELDDVLDLLSYLIAEADPEHSAFAE